MSFLNVMMLAGLAGVAIPPIIHLLNRRRYDVVDWGAMQFLQLSEVTRRRLLLEELLLMLLRMGLIAVLLAALAGPYTDAPRPGLAAALLAGLAAAVLVGAATGLFAGAPAGILAGLAAGVVAAVVVGLTEPPALTRLAARTAGQRPNRDVVLIFDGSASMT